MKGALALKDHELKDMELVKLWKRLKDHASVMANDVYASTQRHFGGRIQLDCLEGSTNANKALTYNRTKWDEEVTVENASSSTFVWLTKDEEPDDFEVSKVADVAKETAVTSNPHVNILIIFIYGF